MNYLWDQFVIKNSFRFKKSLGQNFLLKESLLSNMVQMAKLGEKVIEIGPGSGLLTNHLVLQNQIKELILIEKDDLLYQFLKEHFVDEKIQIKHEDALNYDYNIDFDIIANLPYNISKLLLLKWLNTPIKNITIMLQKEVAESILADISTKEYKMISVLCRVFFDVKLCFLVSRKNFKPVPGVDSAVIRLTRKRNLEINTFDLLFKTVKQAFQQRRKKISNSILGFDLGEKSNLRPENLTPEEFLLIVEKELENRRIKKLTESLI